MLRTILIGTAVASHLLTASATPQTDDTEPLQSQADLYWSNRLFKRELAATEDHVSRTYHAHPGRG